MPSGVHLTSLEKRQICNGFSMHGWSPTLCHLYLFAGSEDRVSLDYLTRLQARLYGSTIEEQESMLLRKKGKKK